MPSSSLVSIITRTQNRPGFLQRARDSLARQTHQNLEWIVVNDGGAEPVEEASIGLPAPRRSRVVNLGTSLGMEGALERGRAHATGEYAAIHDDDDTWEDRFLQEMVAQLDGHPFCVGVVCSYWTIEEELFHGQAVERRRSLVPLTPGFLLRRNLLLRNQFPPIALLMRAQAFHEVRIPTERPVLGDWLLHLQLLDRGPLLRCPTTLANYHVRLNTQDSQANSVVAKLGLHVTGREEILADMIENEGPSLQGQLLVQILEELHEVKDRLRRIEEKPDGLSRLASRVRRLLGLGSGGRSHRRGPT